jgi:hypothetical protein
MLSLTLQKRCAECPYRYLAITPQPNRNAVAFAAGDVRRSSLRRSSQKPCAPPASAPALFLSSNTRIVANIEAKSVSRMRPSVFMLLAALLLPCCTAEPNGCFTLEGWKSEDGCSSRLFCDTGSRCNQKTGPLCKFGLVCDGETSTCQPLKPLGANCTGGWDCASGICMPGAMEIPICADSGALPCGQFECGLGSFCTSEGAEFQVSPSSHVARACIHLDLQLC